MNGDVCRRAQAASQDRFCSSSTSRTFRSRSGADRLRSITSRERRLRFFHVGRVHCAGAVFAVTTATVRRDVDAEDQGLDQPTRQEQTSGTK